MTGNDSYLVQIKVCLRILDYQNIFNHDIHYLRNVKISSLFRNSFVARLKQNNSSILVELEYQ